MGYAVRNDGLGWRSVNSQADCTISETYSLTQPVLNLPPVSDGVGFVQAVKTAMGGIVPSNVLAAKYPLFFDAVSAANWPDVQSLIIDANTNGVINSTQYTAIKSAATKYNIPITLP